MNTRILALIGICSLAGFTAQAQSADDSAPKRSPDELNELLGPIALYPDPLISLILPASTVPSDIVLADRYAEKGGDPDATDDKPWDASVKGLVRYPDTLKWLDDNLDWTTQVGDAFLSQPVDVMEAIQALRAKAKEVGNLVDTPQERIVQDDNEIRILPAEEDSISVPSYDPEVIYQRRIVDAPPVYFSEPYRVGPWLGYDFDWHHHNLYWGEWHRGWHYGHERDSRVFINNSFTNTRIWHVDVKRREFEVSRHPTQHVTVVHGTRGPGKIVKVPVAHPVKPIVLAGHGPAGHHTGPVVTGGKPGTKPGKTAVLVEDHPKEGGKGHVTLPKTGAPGTGKEGKPHMDLPKGEGHPHVDLPKGEGKPHVDMPKKIEHHDDLKKVEHHDMPKKVEHHDEPKKVEHHDMPKKVEHHDEPKKVEHHDMPKKVEHHEEPRKVEHHEAPKKVEHHEAPKKVEHHEPAKGHSDKDKKKDHN